jgi:hypothetical protein
MKNYWERYHDLWCEFMHDGAMWPIHGEYRCRECLRVHDVPWAEKPVVARRNEPGKPFFAAHAA